MAKEFLRDVKETVNFGMETIFRNTLEILMSAELGALLDYDKGDRTAKNLLGISEVISCFFLLYINLKVLYFQILFSSLLHYHIILLLNQEKIKFKLLFR